MKNIRRWLLIACGMLCVAVGVIGIFVPLLPTTSPLLLAAFCFARSSPRFYHWLLHNRVFGSYIKNYREGRGMPLRSKFVTLALLWLTIGFSIIYITPWWIKLLLLIIALGVTIHILWIKTYRPETVAQPSEQNSL